MIPTETQNLRYFSLRQTQCQRYEASLQNLGNVVLSQTAKDASIQLDDN